MNTFRPGGFSVLPPVVKNLLLINIIMFVVSYLFRAKFNTDLSVYLGLHYPGSENFMPVQFVTYMFMHADIGHIFFNMFALWMFGNALENLWGPQKFLTYYFVTGIGAGVLQAVVQHIQLSDITEMLSPDYVDMIKNEGAALMKNGQNYTNSVLGHYNQIMNGPTVGASGAVFGLLLAFGMTFPNSLLYLYFAIPVKAKWFVIGYGVIELYSGMQNNPGDNVAHFAHLGGMLFGLILIYYWRRKGTYLK